MEVFADKLSEAIQVMAEKLGVSAEKLYPILIRQAHIEARLALLWAVIGLAMLIFIGIMIYQFYFKTIDDGGYKTTRSSNWEFGHFAFWALAVIGAFIGLIIFSDNLHTCITAFYNPEWHAIKMILDLVK